MNLILSGLAGILGALVSIPIALLILSRLNRDEQEYQRKLDIISKQRQLLMEHKLEMERQGGNGEITQIKDTVARLERTVEQMMRQG